MAETLQQTELSPYRVAVQNHLDRLVAEYEAGHLNGGWFDRELWVRHDANPWKAFIRRRSIGGWFGLVLGVAVTAAGNVVDQATVSGDRSGTVTMFAGLLGIAVWALVAHAAGCYTDGVEVEVSGTGAYMTDVIDDAVAEIDVAVARGHKDAPAIRAAVTSLRPGVEELLDEDYALSRAIRRCSNSLVRYEYREALIERRHDVHHTLMNICAELTAVSGLLFASRDDLLVALANAGADEPLTLPTTKLTADTQRTLAASRKVLADIAENLA